MIQKVRVVPWELPDTRTKRTLAELVSFGLPEKISVVVVKVYRLEGISAGQAVELSEKLLSEAITERASVNSKLFTDSSHMVEVGLQPGMMDEEEEPIIRAAKALGVSSLTAVSTSREYHFYGLEIDKAVIDEIFERSVINKTIERRITTEPETLIQTGVSGAYEIVPLTKLDLFVEECKRRKVYFSLREAEVVYNHFVQILGRDPTNVELQVIAGLWCEHCRHQLWRQLINMDGILKEPLIHRLINASRPFFGERVGSAFEDNAGAVRLCPGWYIVFKIESHNKPSAIAPYGGAGTCVGGVIRDIFGTGLGAIPIEGQLLLCFGPQDTLTEEIFPGCLHPRQIKEGVIAGTRDYGNRMGIPTTRVKITYDKRHKERPAVLGMTIGIQEDKYVKKGKPKPGDMAFLLGGRTGRDGILGATFSSAAMNAETAKVHSNAVQIGCALEEEKFGGALLEMRDLGCVNAVTDCGALGITSATGEMGEEGVVIELDKIPVKYQGLTAEELAISESQERMVVAVPAEKLELAQSICKKHRTEGTVIGTFTGDGSFKMKFGEKMVCELDTKFALDGWPKAELTATWVPTILPEPVIKTPSTANELESVLLRMLSDPNAVSQKETHREYDHTVRAGNMLHAYTGVGAGTPNDASVTKPFPDQNVGIVSTQAIAIAGNEVNPRQGTLNACVAALAQITAVGADYRNAAFGDNVVCPRVADNPLHLGILSEMVDGMVEAINAFEVPTITGKDSTSQTFENKEKGIVVHSPPLTCMSAVAPIDDVRKTVSGDLKKVGSVLVLLGEITPALGGSLYYQIHGALGNTLPKPDLAKTALVFQALHRAISDGKVLSCRAVGMGGVAKTLFDMSAGSQGGVEVKTEALGKGKIDELLFTEQPGAFVVEMEASVLPNARFSRIPHCIIGKTIKERWFELLIGDSTVTLEMETLEKAWQGEKEVMA